jgi:hypothetical protein
MDILAGVRKEKSNAKKPMNCEVRLELVKKDYDIFERIGLIEDLENVTCAKEIKEGRFNVEFI